jgi:hypothetical protein
MNTKRLFIVAAIMLLAMLAGCAPATTPPASAAGTYTVNLTASDFVNVIDNPYYPLTPGAKYVYESQLEDGTVEGNQIEVLHETREVNGVAATVVHDTVWVDGELQEETFDWYAQDKDGNVWYLGEIVDNYENGVLVDHAGSWEWGVDGALPGIIMYADPAAHLGETYRQEYYKGEAEDLGDVLSASESVTVPFGSFENIVKTYDYSSLDPDLQEHKFYAGGIGLIKENNLKTGEVTVLIEFTQP